MESLPETSLNSPSMNSTDSQIVETETLKGVDLIDPTKLVDQNTDDISLIAATETTTNRIPVDSDQLEKGEAIEATAVDGLPLIGAKAEQNTREKLGQIQSENDLQKIYRKRTPQDPDVWNFRDAFYDRPKGMADIPLGEQDVKRAVETAGDIAGEEAMVAEVGRRAEELVANANEDLKKQVREAAEKKFRDALESKRAEKQQAADDKARELLAKLQGDAPLSDTIPDFPFDPNAIT